MDHHRCVQSPKRPAIQGRSGDQCAITVTFRVISGECAPASPKSDPRYLRHPQQAKYGSSLGWHRSKHAGRDNRRCDHGLDSCRIGATTSQRQRERSPGDHRSACCKRSADDPDLQWIAENPYEPSPYRSCISASLLAWRPTPGPSNAEIMGASERANAPRTNPHQPPRPVLGNCRFERRRNHAQGPARGRVAKADTTPLSERHERLELGDLLVVVAGVQMGVDAVRRGD